MSETPNPNCPLCQGLGSWVEGEKCGCRIESQDSFEQIVKDLRASKMSGPENVIIPLREALDYIADRIEITAGRHIWQVSDSDNYTCESIISLHYSEEGALAFASALSHSAMKYRNDGENKEWYSDHRTISVQRSQVKP